MSTIFSAIIPAIPMILGFFFCKTFNQPFDFPNKEVLLYAFAFPLTYINKYPILNYPAAAFATLSAGLYSLALIVEHPNIASIKGLDLSPGWLYWPGLLIVVVEMLIYFRADSKRFKREG